MGGSSTYGIEQPNGEIHYNTYYDTVFLDSIQYEIQKGRTVELQEPYVIAKNREDYYSEERNQNEDSVVRGILCLDGSLEWRHWGCIGVYKWFRD